QRVSEEHKAGDVLLATRRNLGGNASPHRFAADHKPAARSIIEEFPTVDRLDHGAIAALQLVIAIGYAPALVSVDKVERYGVDSGRRQRSRKANHEARGLATASPVRKDHDGAGAMVGCSPIRQRGHLLGR